MKLIAIFLTGIVSCLGSVVLAQAPQLAGSWQLVRQSDCLTEQSGEESESAESLRRDMHSRTGSSPRVVTFKNNASGLETTRILNSKRVGNQKKFLYKLNGNMLLILDKKSQTISDSYLVDKFSSDSLIVSHARRPCETHIFVRIDDNGKK